MKKYRVIPVLLLAFFSLQLSGTDLNVNVYDTLRLVEGSKIILPGSIIKIDRDTTIILRSGLNYQVRYPRGEAGDIFFDSLETRASRNKWARQLHNIVITSPRRPDYADTIQTRVSSDPFISYGGKYIRSVRYQKLEAFGPTIFDTTARADTRLERFGNEMHQVTQDRIIENHLLFNVGDLLEPNELADNERILRELPFIHDARILITESAPGSDSVDIVVLTKDNFSLGLGGALTEVDAGRLSLFESNLFGLGQELHMTFHWDAQRSPWLGNEIAYVINNLGGSFINSKLRFASIFNAETYELEFRRRFFTPDIKWAGALNLERTRESRYIEYADSVAGPMTVKFNKYDTWLGRSFYLSSQRKLVRNRINLVLASRIYRHHFIDRPDVSENSFYQYHNNIVWLSSFSISSQSFFKSNLILDFGRTEDVPQGMLISLTFGPEFKEFKRRLYTGINLSQGRYLANFGYLYTQLEAGGFIKDLSHFEQGVVHAEVDYFTPLFIINRFKVRHFIDARYIRGIRRFEDEKIRISSLDEIRGFRTNLPEGRQKVFLNYELDAFTPYYLYGFRFVLFGFLDMGMIGPEDRKWHDGAYYSGMGIGIRIRNERLVFETISIRLGYYPNHPEKSIPLFMDFYGEQRLNPNYFYVTKPTITEFE